MTEERSECTFHVHTCPVAGEASPVLNLGRVPLGYPVDQAVKESGKIWLKELDLRICRKCLLARTMHDVPSGRLAEENFYPSKTNRLVTDHDREFARTIPSRLGLAPGNLVLEIGCGDGSLLDQFAEEGFKVLGIDAAVHPNGYPYEVIPGFFDHKVVDRLKREGRSPACVVFNYVLELVPDLATFFLDLKTLVKNDAYLVFEVPYLGDFVNPLRLDGFVHLRCQWFTVTSLVHLCHQFGFQVTDALHDTEYRGGTICIVAKKKETITECTPKIVALMEEEKRTLTEEAFQNLRADLADTREMVRREIRSLLDEGWELYGYGAGHKASTIVNWLGFTKQEIRKLCDVDPYKHGKMMPVADIVIESPDTLIDSVKDRPVAVLNLALDHTREVEAFLKTRLVKGSRLIQPVPTFNITHVE